jgi:integrase
MNNDLTHYRDKSGVHYFESPEVRCHCGHVLPDLCAGENPCCSPRFFNKVGLPWCTPHCLRHCAATMADKAGLTVAEKQKILVHRTADMSLHYSIQS